MSHPQHRVRRRLPASFAFALLLSLGLVAGCVATGGGGYFGGIPRGSYRESCEGIRMDGYRLKASCRTERGSWRRASLDVRTCDDDIVNQNGYLRCAYDDEYYGALPPGSYIRSCTDLRVRRGILEAECRRDDHRWRHTAARVNACKRFRNRDGKLACE
jgi:hypothetical protein